MPTAIEHAKSGLIDYCLQPQCMQSGSWHKSFTHAIRPHAERLLMQLSVSLLPSALLLPQVQDADDG